MPAKSTKSCRAIRPSSATSTQVFNAKSIEESFDKFLVVDPDDGDQTATDTLNQAIDEARTISAAANALNRIGSFIGIYKLVKVVATQSQITEVVINVK